ncbi:MAG: alpha amylase C-terminal domain-containing protein, partial [Actinomycetota bacterium]
VRALNALYRRLPSLHAVDRDPAGFEWVVGDDRDQSVLAYLRWSPAAEPVLVVMNNTPVVRTRYRIGVPRGGAWMLLANSDDHGYGGSGVTPGAIVDADDEPAHGREQSLALDLPPLGMVLLAPA